MTDTTQNTNLFRNTRKIKKMQKGDNCVLMSRKQCPWPCPWLVIGLALGLVLGFGLGLGIDIGIGVGICIGLVWFDLVCLGLLELNWNYLGVFGNI